MAEHEWVTATVDKDLCSVCGLRRGLTNDREQPFEYWPPTRARVWVTIGEVARGVNWTDPGGCPWWKVPGAYNG